MRDDHEEILEFWLGALDAHGLASEAHRRRWWNKDPAFDEEIRRRFLAAHQAVLAGQRARWLDTPSGRLASIIVLDQFSRNMFRDTPRMFAADHRAQQLTLDGLAGGDDGALPVDPRVFCYMPLMHAEDLALQDRCVSLFTALRDTLAGPARQRIDNNLRFAIQHREIIARFGRFPHRNAALGRPSTAEELAFLEQPGSSF